MRHFLFFLAAVFVIVFLAHVNRGTAPSEVSGKPVLRVFGYGSFVSRWGPGPELKKLFETTCNCLVEFIEGSDSGILLQRLRIEGESLGAVSYTHLTLPT
ncbi:MAG: hypothetical protein N2578_09460, partial [Bdellovibrionaceae bacterium]|nr:hypothetical protein [Pseudobdellovibrionaceae bacterium]